MAKYRVPALDKFAAVVDLLSNGEPLELSEMVRRLEIPKASLYRLLLAMQDRGYVSYDEDTHRFGLGFGLLEIGTSLLDHIPLRVQALPHLQRLTTETWLSSHLGVVEGVRAVFVATIQSPTASRVAARVGRSFALYPAAPGAVVLAHMGAKEISQRIREDKLVQLGIGKSPKTSKQLESLLAEVRQQGFYIDDEYSAPGIRCVGAPVFDARGRVSAGVCVSGTVETMTSDRMDALIKAVVTCAERVSMACGYDRFAGTV